MAKTGDNQAKKTKAVASPSPLGRLGSSGYFKVMPARTTGGQSTTQSQAPIKRSR